MQRVNTYTNVQENEKTLKRKEENNNNHKRTHIQNKQKQANKYAHTKNSKPINQPKTTKKAPNKQTPQLQCVLTCFWEDFLLSGSTPTLFNFMC